MFQYGAPLPRSEHNCIEGPVGVARINIIFPKVNAFFGAFTC